MLKDKMVSEKPNRPTRHADFSSACRVQQQAVDFAVFCHFASHTTKSKFEAEKGSNLLFLLIGGQGRNRTTDTRIFSPFSAVLGA